MSNVVVFFLSLFWGFVPFEMMGYLEGGLPSVAKLLGSCVMVSAAVAVCAGHRLRLLDKVLAMQIVYVSYSVLSVVWALSPSQTLGTVTRMFLNFLLAVFVWEFAVTFGQQLWLLRSFVVGLLVPLSLCFGAFLGFYRFAEDTSDEVVRFSGAHNDQNYLAMLLSLGIVMAVYFTIEPSKLDRRLRPFYWTFVGMAAIGVRLTGSKSGFICLILAGIFSAFMVGVSRRKILYTVGVLGFMVFVVVVARYVVPAALLGRSSDLSTGAGSRFVIWQRGLTYSWVQNPLAGIGVGGYNVVTTELSNIKTGVAHNMVVSTLVESGAIGLSLYVTLFYFAFRAAWGMPRREKILWLALLSIWTWESMALTLLTDKLFWLLPALAACQSSTLAQARAGQRRPSRSARGAPMIGPLTRPQGRNG